MRVGMVVINSAIGGTEKRFLNLFRLFPTFSSDKCELFIPEVLFQKYITSNLLSNEPTPGICRLYRYGLNSIYPLEPIQFGIFRIRGMANVMKPFWRKELHQAIDKHKPDILHIALPTDHLRPLPNMPIVVEFANNTGENLDTWLIKQVVTKNCLINCASEKIRQMLVAAFPDIEVEAKTRVIPCSFIDYSSIPYDVRRQRQRRIVFIGRLEPLKNPFTFLNAIELLSKRVSDFSAILLGCGSLEQPIRSWINNHQLSEKITVAYERNPISVLSESLVYVSAYQHDNYHSQALFEAMACGCAIVATDVGETRNLVDESCGFLTTSDPEEIAKHLEYLLDHEDIAKIMGLSARQKVMQEHTFERYLDHLMKIYNECLELWNKKNTTG